jgi:hypothetical protein
MLHAQVLNRSWGGSELPGGVGEGSGTGRPTMMGQCGWAVRAVGKAARRCLGVRTGDGSG